MAKKRLGTVAGTAQTSSARPAVQGSQGIGKFDLAMGFAESLLCQRPDEAGFACGQCPSCHWFTQGSHPDFRLLQPEALSLDGGNR